MRQLAGPDHRRARALLAQPPVDREPVEPVGVRVAPGIIGIDGARQLAGQAGEPLRVGPLGVGHPRKVVAPVDAVDQVGCHLARLGDVARPERQAELRDELEIGRVELADQLAPELKHAAVGKRRLLHTAAGPVARLEHEHVDPGPVEIPGGRQAGEAGADHEDVGHRPARRPSLRTRSPIRERSVSASSSSPGTVSASSQWFSRTSATSSDNGSAPSRSTYRSSRSLRSLRYASHSPIPALDDDPLERGSLGLLGPARLAERCGQRRHGGRQHRLGLGGQEEPAVTDGRLGHGVS